MAMMRHIAPVYHQLFMVKGMRAHLEEGEPLPRICRDASETAKIISNRQRVVKPYRFQEGMDPSWESGYSGIKYQDPNGKSQYGIVMRLMYIQVFLHPKSPSLFLAEVIPCDHGPGSSALDGIVIRGLSLEGVSRAIKLVPGVRICSDTTLFMPAIKKDLDLGFTHNIVNLR